MNLRVGGNIVMNCILEYDGYRAAAYYDREDGIFVGEVLGIADSLSFHGKSREALEEAFHQSIENYISLCRNIGKPPERESSGASLRMPGRDEDNVYPCQIRQAPVPSHAKIFL